MQTSKLYNRRTSKLGKKRNHKKIARAYGILRGKRLKALKIERALRNEWR